MPFACKLSLHMAVLSLRHFTSVASRRFASSKTLET